MIEVCFGLDLGGGQDLKLKHMAYDNSRELTERVPGKSMIGWRPGPGEKAHGLGSLEGAGQPTLKKEYGWVAARTCPGLTDQLFSNIEILIVVDPFN